MRRLKKAKQNFTYWKKRKIKEDSDILQGPLADSIIGGKYDPGNQHIEIYVDSIQRIDAGHIRSVINLIIEASFHEDMHYALDWCDQDTYNEQYVQKIERVYGCTAVQELWNKRNKTKKKE